MSLLNRCYRCNRVLKDPVSCELGYGPVCAAKEGITYSRAKGTSKSASMKISESPPCKLIWKPYTGDVYFRTTTGTISEDIETNVPKMYMDKSPTGFSWGYHGSGPACLALNILAMYIGLEKAEAGGLYQDFKREFIAIAPPEGMEIKGDVIRMWLQNRGVVV